MDDILKVVFEGGVAEGDFRLELVEEGLQVSITPINGETIEHLVPAYMVQMALQMLPGE